MALVTSQTNNQAPTAARQNIGSRVKLAGSSTGAVTDIIETMTVHPLPRNTRVDPVRVGWMIDSENKNN